MMLISGVLFELLSVACAQKTLFAWSGAVTDTGVTIKAKFDDAKTVDVEVGKDLNAEVEQTFSASLGGLDVFSAVASGLQPATQYQYRFKTDGVEDSFMGRFKTLPVSNSFASFRFGFASCAENRSSTTVWDNMRNQSFDFFLHAGDLFYGDYYLGKENEPVHDDIEFYMDNYENQLKSSVSPRQASFYASTPVAFMYDDHDFGPNDSSSDCICKEVATQAYRSYVPHYPLAAYTTPDAASGGVTQRFDVGRVRFLLPDQRYFKSPKGQDAGPTKSVLGVEGKAWLKQQMLQAAEDGKAIVWLSGIPLIGEEKDGVDQWWGYADERAEMAQFIQDNNLTDRLLVLSGDAHQIAIDNGDNNKYAEPAMKGFVNFVAAGIDRPFKSKGGPYSEGMVSGTGQYGVVEVLDSGSADSISVKLIGKYWNETDSTENDLMSLDVTLSTRVVSPPSTISPPSTMEGSNTSTMEGSKGFAVAASSTHWILVSAVVFLVAADSA